MARLTSSVISSLDGYVADEAGDIDWAAPDEQVHAVVNDLERPVGTYLYGRQLYGVMVAWSCWTSTASTTEWSPFTTASTAEPWSPAQWPGFPLTPRRRHRAGPRLPGPGRPPERLCLENES